MTTLLQKARGLFPGQQPTERIYLATRPHWVALLKEIAVWLLFAALPIVFDAWILPEFEFLRTSPAQEIVNLIKTIYIMFLVGALFSIWILYYLNYQIITNERIVDVTQKNLLHHTTSELHLDRIQDVTAEISGLFGNLFNYGNVYVQTAGEQTRFVFDRVPRPHSVAKLILDLYERVPSEQKISKG
ncbi:MAG: hypothetical protein A3K06_00595 [Candidatus Doudnabacteria bacterium RIFCSPHIGHO2_01_52_17]|uniref:YdbS-like PH domain-containing protein n=1 Tax=Candidatus Doudnabacteria bacterium RIFCSPHIGHO2_01_52_17 TaxID=1817820 RepID=A0A1F5NDG9_9BACT|nr:MAG: hypothetical protein A3K06_00595 [Candidatus Doudnabacteria bacterium RIFCSPHIGHO2_01_52_17]